MSLLLEKEHESRRHCRLVVVKQLPFQFEVEVRNVGLVKVQFDFRRE